MATTWLKPLHAGAGRSIAKALKRSVDYLENPFKTNERELISSYECDARTADFEFLLSKQRYASLTGREQGQRDVIAYHVRQSFKPEEITPEEANRIGYELAERFTKGKYAFIVCTHIDKPHVHNHIIWNSTALDCKRKFRNFIGSAFALRRCSDIICAENGLSVVKNPKPSPGRDYARHMFGEGRRPSFQERLRQTIDAALEKKPATFEEFVSLMRTAGCTVLDGGKHLKFLAPHGEGLPDQEKPTRCNTLRGDYTEDAIRERIAGRRVSSSAGSAPEAQRPGLLIDIEAKMREGKGLGYDLVTPRNAIPWGEEERRSEREAVLAPLRDLAKSATTRAKLHNLKQMAQTLIYLQENGLDDYAVLKQKTSAAVTRFNELSDRIKKLDSELNANASLQKNLVNYAKTRAVYVEYRKAGYSKKFRELHEADILLHQSAKKAFDELGLKKLPTVASLRKDYAPALEEKKKAYREYRKVKAEMRELLTALNNVDRLLGSDGHRSEHETGRANRDGDTRQK
jgi:hypothetical protein